jgi:N-acetylmuramoyl-L-alanine amidase
LYPTRGDRHLTVFLDAGHGGMDPGAVGQTESGKVVHEANLTLAVELDAAALLREDGFAVVVSRTRNSLVARLGRADFAGKLLSPAGVRTDIAARDRCANMAGAAALVGIYFDAGYSAYNAGSLTAYDRARPFWRASLRLATLVQHDVLAKLNAHGWGIPDDGVLEDVGLGGPALDPASAVYGHLLLLGPGVSGWFTTPSQMPGALIEPLFVTDPFEATIAASPAGQRAIAGGLARAVEQYFGAR